MTIQAQYTDEAHTQIKVVLDGGDRLGNFSGPVEFFVGMAPGNKEHDELELLVAEEKVTVADFVPPPAPIPNISDRQFFTQLALDKVITFEEAEATSDGTMPKMLMDAIDTIDDDTQRFILRMAVKNATTFERHSPFVPAIQAALNWDDDRLDKLWLDASKL